MFVYRSHLSRVSAARNTRFLRVSGPRVMGSLQFFYMVCWIKLNYACCIGEIAKTLSDALGKIKKNSNSPSYSFYKFPLMYENYSRVYNSWSIRIATQPKRQTSRMAIVSTWPTPFERALEAPNNTYPFWENKTATPGRNRFWVCNLDWRRCSKAKSSAKLSSWCRGWHLSWRRRRRRARWAWKAYYRWSIKCE
jgi:hypothetical protein